MSSKLYVIFRRGLERLLFKIKTNAHLIAANFGFVHRWPLGDGISISFHTTRPERRLLYLRGQNPAQLIAHRGMSTTSSAHTDAPTTTGNDPQMLELPVSNAEEGDQAPKKTRKKNKRVNKASSKSPTSATSVNSSTENPDKPVKLKSVQTVIKNNLKYTDEKLSSLKTQLSLLTTKNKTSEVNVNLLKLKSLNKYINTRRDVIQKLEKEIDKLQQLTQLELKRFTEEML